MEKQVIFNNHCAGWLMQQGFVLQDMGKRDKDNKQMNIYVFNKTKELEEKLKEYKTITK